MWGLEIAGWKLGQKIVIEIEIMGIYSQGCLDKTLL